MDTRRPAGHRVAFLTGPDAGRRAHRLVGRRRALRPRDEGRSEGPRRARGSRDALASRRRRRLRGTAHARAQLRHEVDPPTHRRRSRGEPMKPADAASILVVDDTPANLGFLIETLSQAGYSVRVATDG